METEVSDIRRARKQYQCDYCTLPIPAGFTYSYYRAVPWDGGNECFGDVRLHLKCHFADWEAGDVHPSVSAGEFMEWIRECEEGALMDLLPGIRPSGLEHSQWACPTRMTVTQSSPRATSAEVAPAPAVSPSVLGTSDRSRPGTPAMRRGTS